MHNDKKNSCNEGKLIFIWDEGIKEEKADSKLSEYIENAEFAVCAVICLLDIILYFYDGDDDDDYY